MKDMISKPLLSIALKMNLLACTCNLVQYWQKRKGGKGRKGRVNDDLVRLKRVFVRELSDIDPCECYIENEK